MQIGSLSPALKEHRLTGLMKEVWPNLKTWGRDTNETYVQAGLRERDPLKIGLAVPAVLASTAFETFDYAYAGIVDDRLEPPDGGAFSRTRRDIGDIAKNNIRHPLRTLLGVVRTPGDVVFDSFDTVVGYQHTGAARAQMEALMSDKLLPKHLQN